MPERHSRFHGVWSNHDRRTRWLEQHIDASSGRHRIDDTNICRKKHHAVREFFRGIGARIVPSIREAHQLPLRIILAPYAIAKKHVPIRLGRADVYTVRSRTLSFRSPRKCCCLHALDIRRESECSNPHDIALPTAPKIRQEHARNNEEDGDDDRELEESESS